MAKLFWRMLATWSSPQYSSMESIFAHLPGLGPTRLFAVWFPLSFSLPHMSTQPQPTIPQPFISLHTLITTLKLGWPLWPYVAFFTPQLSPLYYKSTLWLLPKRNILTPAGLSFLDISSPPPPPISPKLIPAFLKTFTSIFHRNLSPHVHKTSLTLFYIKDWHIICGQLTSNMATDSYLYAQLTGPNLVSLGVVHIISIWPYHLAYGGVPCICRGLSKLPPT